MKNSLLRYVLILFFSLSKFMNVNSEEFLTGLDFEPHELYASVPLKQANHQVSKRGLPVKVDLRDQLPPAGFQGKQGSCVAFATSYAVQSYYEFLNRRKFFPEWNSLKIGNSINPKAVFSPAFVHNSLHKGKDSGITYFEALNFLVNHGSVPWEYMPYDPQSFEKPSLKLYEIAENYRIKDFKRINFLNIEEIKSFLANREPVLVGIVIYSNLQDLKASEIYSNHEGKPLGGHAVVLVGYDDEKNAFLFLNSWGEKWADSGFGWIDYDWYLKTARVGYIIGRDKQSWLPRNGIIGNYPIYLGNLEPPSEIFATQGNYPDKIILTWEKVPNALGYEIYRSFAHEENFVKVGISTINMFVDDGVLSEIAYSYKIITLGENQTSVFSSQKVIGFATKGAKEIPPKVTGLKASRGTYSDRIRLEWDDLKFGITSYQVYRWDLKTKVFKPIAKVQTNWYEDKTISKNSPFETYIVVGLNRNITGIPSNSVTGRISIENKLEAPKNFYATQGTFPNKIVLSWKKVVGAKEYLVYLYNKDKWEIIGQTTNEEFVHETKDRAKNIYVIHAIDEKGNYGEFSEPAIGFIEPKLSREIARLSPPGSLRISQNNETVVLDWLEVPDASAYNVWLKKLGETKWTFWGNVRGSTRTSFMIDLPEKDIVYLFTVTSIGENFLESSYSPVVSAVYSTAKKSAQPRAFPSLSKLQRIQGTWMGVFWESFTAKNLVLKIEAQENSIVKISFNDKKTYEAKYVPESNEIEVEGKIKIRLENLRALIVELKDKTIVNESIEVAFLRQ